MRNPRKRLRALAATSLVVAAGFGGLFMASPASAIVYPVTTFAAAPPSVHYLQNQVPTVRAGASGTIVLDPTPAGISIRSSIVDAPLGVILISGNCQVWLSATKLSCPSSGISAPGQVQVSFVVPFGAAAGSLLTGFATTNQFNGTVIIDPYYIRVGW